MNILTSVALGWLGRRFQELGSLLAIIVPIYLGMPAEHQRGILAILTGQGGGLSISAAFGLGWYLWTQWQSYRATTRPQVVTDEGKRVETDKLAPAAQQTINATVKAAPKTILDALIDKLNKTR